ncbi:hypothetical protein BD779DRAFT_1518165 [Infundibulicybe gibba]|nr:hypothetical protein BD779DRAFT_1518165 [Infundibulicybe gibba]
MDHTTTRTLRTPEDTYNQYTTRMPPQNQIYAPRPQVPLRRPFRNGQAQHHQQVSTNASSIKTFLDSTFRGYAGRIHAELTNLRSACTRAIFKEQQEAEKWKAHCRTFCRERDAARANVKLLLAQQEAHRARLASVSSSAGSSRGTKRQRDDSNGPDSRQSSPSSSASIPVTTTPPPRPGVTANDSTAFDVTLLNSARLRIPNHHPKKRRRKSSAESDSSENTLVSDAQRPTPDISEGSWFQESGETGIRVNSGPESSSKESEFMEGVSWSPSPPRSPKSDTVTSRPAQIEVAHVDLMYIAEDGKLVCRACKFCGTSDSRTPSSGSAPVSFPTDASWNTLRDHCVKEHPTACADVARLHPAEVYELRRRLALLK